MITVTTECEHCGRSDDFSTDDWTDHDHPDPAEDAKATMSDVWDWVERHGRCTAKERPKPEAV